MDGDFQSYYECGECGELIGSWQEFKKHIFNHDRNKQ